MNYGAISQWIRDNHPGFEFQIHPELTVKIEKEISDYRRAISKVVYALGGVPDQHHGGRGPRGQRFFTHWRLLWAARDLVRRAK